MATETNPLWPEPTSHLEFLVRYLLAENTTMVGRILGIVPLCLLSAIATGARTPVADVRTPAIAQAQVDSGVAGRWTAQITGDSKVFTVNFDFVVKGGVLSGTVEFPSQDKEYPIENGTIKGNDIAFTGFGAWTGTLVGRELRLTRGLDYGKKQKMVAHRAPAARAK